MRFDITKKIPLEYEGWQDCYLEFFLPTFNDIKSLTGENQSDEEKVQSGLDALKKMYKSGYAMSDGKRVEIAKDDVDNLPVEVLNKCLSVVSGEVPPKP